MSICFIVGLKEGRSFRKMSTFFLHASLRIRKTFSQMMTQTSGFMEINYFVIYTHTYMYI